MGAFDVCNGDADGLCAVRQWRLDAPAPAVLVTGLKRDIALLDRVDAGQGDTVLVCDLSMARNAQALGRLLARGAQVRWFDHHAAGEVPAHPRLRADIDTSPTVCSSLLVDRALHGRHRAWALVGAFGDNLIAPARQLAAASGVAPPLVERLRALGEAINYNAYGEPSDVLIAPAALYAVMARHDEPLSMLADEAVVAELIARRQADLACALRLPPRWHAARGSLRMLPDAPWSRRVVGSLAHELARREPARAQAVLLPVAGGAWRVSVRAPLDTPSGADALCRRFGGAGRAGAAGIDALPDGDLERFRDAFLATHWERPA